jgi:hypothetical protein
VNSAAGYSSRFAAAAAAAGSTAVAASRTNVHTQHHQQAGPFEAPEVDVELFAAF